MFRVMTLWSFQVCIILGFSLSSEGFAISNYNRYQNSAIYGYNNVHLTGVTPEDCAQRCNEERSFTCRSFDYYKNDQKCDLSSKDKNMVGGLKTDYEGNPFDHYERGFAISNYNRYQNSAIYGYNNVHLTGVTPEDCAQRCNEERSFTCRSFDYYKNDQKCDLSSKDKNMVGGLKTDYEGNPFDHYERDPATIVVPKSPPTSDPTTIEVPKSPPTSENFLSETVYQVGLSVCGCLILILCILVSWIVYRMKCKNKARKSTTRINNSTKKAYVVYDTKNTEPTTTINRNTDMKEIRKHLNMVCETELPQSNITADSSHAFMKCAPVAPVYIEIQ